MIVATVIRGAALAQVLDFVGRSAVLKIHAGPVPANCEATPGALLARLALPTVWLTPAGMKVGEWREASADGTGVASYFRIYTTDEATCALQGVVGAELRLDSPDFVAGEDFTISRFRLTVAGDGSISCSARGQSFYRRLIRELCRQSGAQALVTYRSLIRDLKTSISIPVSDTEYLLTQEGDVLTTQGGVPFQLEGHPA